MTTPIDTLPPGQQPASSASGNNKPLWVAIGILGAAVLAMGGTMLYRQNPPAPAAMVAAATTNATTAPQYPMARQLAAPAASANLADDQVEKPVAPAAKPAPEPAPVKQVSKPVHAPAPAPRHSGVSPTYAAPTHVAAASRCAVCGTVESVTPVQRSAKPAGVGVGTVAGGVLGAVLGNQVGHGNGRAAATVLGAVGGGFAGNAIEGRMRTETVYQVGVRMEDGSRRMVEVAHAPGVGSPVTVDGATLRTRDGAIYSPK